MKISVIGGGNAGCFTALVFAWHLKDRPEHEVELLYNPEIPPERVGQATVLDPPRILWSTLGFNWYKNPIHATMNSGILYEGWGNVNDEVFHEFPGDLMAMHFCPWEMQKYILESGWFKVVECDIDEFSVDADYVIDCRGKPDDFSDYDELVNPTNACILGKPGPWWKVEDNPYSRHVATPDGWMFVIPTPSSSPSHEYCVGYCYNKDITSTEEAKSNFYGQYDVEITKCLEYKNYVAKNPVIDGRVFLNGNRLFFLEPMESSSTQTYIEQAWDAFETIFQGRENDGTDIKDYVNRLQNFVLWHYQFGSKYDTPFWEYAKSLPFHPDREFNYFVETAIHNNWSACVPHTYGGSAPDRNYGQWPQYSFKRWYEGMTNEI